MKKRTAIVNANIFDGRAVCGVQNVVVCDHVIESIGADVPQDADVIDGAGCTLLPGLFDSHVHAGPFGSKTFRDVIQFGITTQIEMMGHWTPEQRREFVERDDLADMRTPLMAVCAPGGHPFELFGGHKAKGNPDGEGPKFQTVTSPEDAVAFVRKQVSDGADFIKVMIEEGTVLGSPNLPMPSRATFEAAINEAHALGKQVVAHTLTLESYEYALSLGVDIMGHVFMDKPMPDALIETMLARGTKVITCMVINQSIVGGVDASFADDARLRAKLDERQIAHLHGAFGSYREVSFDVALQTLGRMYRAGIPILAGTDTSLPGTVSGASLHHELQILARAGMTPADVLRAATLTPAKTFGLDDRGSIAPGKRADLLLVKGNPAENISDTLNIEHVWRNGYLCEIINK